MRWNQGIKESRNKSKEPTLAWNFAPFLLLRLSGESGRSIYIVLGFYSTCTVDLDMYNRMVTFCSA